MTDKNAEIIWEICTELGMPYDDYTGEPTIIGEIKRLQRCERELEDLKRVLVDDWK